VEHGRIVGVVATEPVRAPFVIDAGGGRSWLSREIAAPIERASPRIRAYYGYCEGALDEREALPSLMADDEGWTWIAEIGHRTFHWARMVFANAARVPQPPRPLASLR